MRGILGPDRAYACERAVPSQLQFRRDQPVLRIDGVILSECPIGAVARRLEVARQRITNLIAAAGRLCWPRRPQLSLPVRQPPEELPPWRRLPAILQMPSSTLSP